jgi:hypothetical protein
MQSPVGAGSTRSARRFLSPRLVVAVGMAVLVSFLVVWIGLDTSHRTGSDFTATYIGSWLLRTGHRTELYNYATQVWAHNALVQPAAAANTAVPPFVEIPVSAVVAAPLSLLNAATAYTVWTALQLGLLIAAAAIVWRAVPRPSGRAAAEALAIIIIPLASYATFDLLWTGQWDGLSALGIAVAYRYWRHGRRASGAACLVVAVLLAKPQLALGLVAFMVGWRDRRAWGGALAAVLGLTVSSLAIVGIAGAKAWLQLVGADSHLYSPTGLYGFIALPSAWFGNSALVAPVASAGILALVGLCFVLGHRLRTQRLSLGPALGTAVCLSLLAAPHSYGYDAVNLIPALIWVLAEYSPFSTDAIVRRRAWTIVALWYASMSAAFVRPLLPDVVLRAGNLAVWIAIALAVCLWRTVHAVPVGDAPTSVPASREWSLLPSLYRRPVSPRPR